MGEKRADGRHRQAGGKPMKTLFRIFHFAFSCHHTQLSCVGIPPFSFPRWNGRTGDYGIERRQKDRFTNADPFPATRNGNIDVVRVRHPIPRLAQCF